MTDTKPAATTATGTCPECPHHPELDYADHGATCPNCGRWWANLPGRLWR